MSKIIDSLVQASLDSKRFSGVLLARLHFNPIQRFNNTGQTIYWDEAGAGEQAYVGVGGLGSISVVPETNELSASSLELKLSGIPAIALTAAFGDTYVGKPVYIWYATLDTTTYAVEGGQNGPVLVFAGRMDTANVIFGKECDIIINATSRLADWERPRGGRFNESYQQRRVDATDLAFKNVIALQDKPISWGGYSLQDPAWSNPNTGNDRDRDRCFAEGTKFLMEDFSLKEIQDIQPNDIMLYGGKVSTVHKGDGTRQQWYLYKEVLVTGSHIAFDNGVWKPVKDCADALPVEGRDYVYSVTNRFNIMIAENGAIFSDYEMIPKGSDEHTRYVVGSLNHLNTRYALNEELSKLRQSLKS